MRFGKSGDARQTTQSVDGTYKLAQNMLASLTVTSASAVTGTAMLPAQELPIQSGIQPIRSTCSRRSSLPVSFRLRTGGHQLPVFMRPTFLPIELGTADRGKHATLQPPITSTVPFCSRTASAGACGSQVIRRRQLFEQGRRVRRGQGGAIVADATGNQHLAVSQQGGGVVVVCTDQVASR